MERTEKSKQASFSLLTFKSSPLHDLKVLCTVSVFIALYTALSFFTIYLSPTIRISFSFLAMAASCFFFGLWPNIIAAFACDFLGFIVNPTGAYVPFFALILIVKAAIYSISFYKREKISVWRIILTQLAVVVLCNIFLNPLILSVMYDMPYWVTAASRIVKNLIMLPIECLLLYLVLQLCIQVQKRTR